MHVRGPGNKKGLSDDSRLHSSAMFHAAPRCTPLHPVAPRNNAPVHLPNENTDVDVDGNARRLAASSEQPTAYPGLLSSLE